jgi:hypothetical protein
MTEWFDQRYISRDEHQQIVDYYRQQVAQLYHELCQLRSQMDAHNIDAMIEMGRRKAEHAFRRSRPETIGDNIIRVDFRRPR